MIQSKFCGAVVGSNPCYSLWTSIVFLSSHIDVSSHRVPERARNCRQRLGKKGKAGVDSTKASAAFQNGSCSPCPSTCLVGTVPLAIHWRICINTRIQPFVTCPSATPHRPDRPIVVGTWGGRERARTGAAAVRTGSQPLGSSNDQPRSGNREAV